MSAVLSIIIPAFNEAKALPFVIDRLMAVEHAIVEKCDLGSLEIIVIDDCSTDASQQLLQKYTANNFTIIRNKTRLGYGGSIKVGLRIARGQYIAFYDMDCTYDPLDLINMFAVLQQENLDMVSGDRLSNLSDMPVTRKLGNLLFVNTLIVLFAKPVLDSCSGIRLFRRWLIQPYLDLLPNTLDFALGMTILSLRFNVKFREIAVSYYERRGQSKLQVLVDGPRFLFTIFRLWIKYRFCAKQIFYVQTILRDS